jgi:peptidoglycan hydrolase-like protein with peptidoglycan-binding domain
VRNLQNRLIALGYLSGVADGDYGSQTTAAIKRFQAALGLETTGITTALLQELLYAPTAPTFKPASPPPAATASPAQYVDLKYGDTGARVQALQLRLMELGYFNGELGGNYLSITTASVKLFQATIGMQQTGNASVAMQEALFSKNAPHYNEATAAPTPTPPKYIELKYGDTGERVKVMQARLMELGYFDGELGGNYLTITMASVKLFQAAMGMQQTGIATVSMQEALFADEAPIYRPNVTPPPTAFIQLSFGDSGEEVRNLQKRLALLGYYENDEISIDGMFNEATRLAVMTFQIVTGADPLDASGVATVEFQQFLFSEGALDFAPIEPGQ